MKNRNEYQAREMAKRIGLVYWQALIEPSAVDPKAFIYAEAVLSKKYGLYTCSDGLYCSGGWDNNSHYGISPSDVVSMWQASGCRNSKKFRFQVANRLVAKKGDSLPFLKNYQKGKKWIKEWRPELEKVPRKTLAVIGRLSPEARYALFSTFQARHAILSTLGTEEYNRQIRLRVRDLDWSRVKNLERLRAEGSERSLLVRAALLPTQLAKTILGLPPSKSDEHPVTKDRVREFCPAYPNLSVEVAGEVAIGTSPVAISNGLLSRKEAHQWLLSGGPKFLHEYVVKMSVIRWLVRGLPLDYFVIRNVEVARWLVHIHQRGAWSALVKIHRYQNGNTLRYLDILDEIIPEDLDRGVTTGVERAFARAAQRLTQINADDHRVICSNPFKHLPKWIRLLTTPAALAMEGRIQDHCVGGYASPVKEGECLILSLISNHCRTTVEVRRGPDGWWVAQHRGYRDGPPPPRHEALVEAWLRRENQDLQREVA